MISMENFWSNFYPSVREDFSDFSFSYNSGAG
jgi:hypothetical protein